MVWVLTKKLNFNIFRGCSSARNLQNFSSILAIAFKLLLLPTSTFAIATGQKILRFWQLKQDKLARFCWIKNERTRSLSISRRINWVWLQSNFDYFWGNLGNAIAMVKNRYMLFLYLRHVSDCLIFAVKVGQKLG